MKMKFMGDAALSWFVTVLLGFLISRLYYAFLRTISELCTQILLKRYFLFKWVKYTLYLLLVCLNIIITFSPWKRPSLQSISSRTVQLSLINSTFLILGARSSWLLNNVLGMSSFWIQSAHGCIGTIVACEVIMHSIYHLSQYNTDTSRSYDEQLKISPKKTGISVRSVEVRQS